MKIREMREAAGYSIADVARIMEVDYSAAYRWDSGELLPKAERLPKLADLLGCTIDALYGRAGPAQTAS